MPIDHRCYHDQFIDELTRRREAIRAQGGLDFPLPDALATAVQQFYAAKRTFPSKYRWPGGGWPVRDEYRVVFANARAVTHLYLGELDSIEVETAALAWSLECCGVQLVADSIDQLGPPMELEFASVLDIGEMGFESPVCLWYSNPSRQPSVIWREDSGMWRVVARDFESFLAMFDQDGMVGDSRTSNESNARPWLM
jgi:hypothetical protein